MMILVDVPSSKDRIVTHLSVWKPVLLGPNNSRIVETTTTLFEGAIFIYHARKSRRGKIRSRNSEVPLATVELGTVDIFCIVGMIEESSEIRTMQKYSLLTTILLPPT